MLFQSQNLQQAQSKDMPPRFTKKGLLNADEVGAFTLWLYDVLLRVEAPVSINYYFSLTD